LKLLSLPTNPSQATRHTLPPSIWSRPTRDMPFHLVYGVDVVLPPKIHLGVARELDVNLVEEEHNKALANVQKYQKSLWHYYNKSVVPQTLEVGDLVTREQSISISCPCKYKICKYRAN
jgi:hypothetical protein